jgi:voltage-gated potassium channel
VSEERRRRWENAATWPLVGAALVFLVAYAWPILDPDLDPRLRALCATTVAVVWVMFITDYLVRLVLADQKVSFVTHHLLDLASVVLPVLRPLQLLRLIRAVTILERTLGDRIQNKVAVYTAAVMTILITVASLAVLESERGRPGASIQNYGEALWWAFVTVTTVGYGDLTPVTPTGRFVAVALMLGGVALLGVVTGTLASYLVNRFDEIDEASQAATRRDIEALTVEVRQLRAELAHLARRDE